MLQLSRPISNIKKIYLSRQKASSTRRQYNENEVINIFKKYGFEIVSPEKLSIVEQISLFDNADFIAGVTGAAFTNILFCKTGCKVLCIQSAKNDLSVFSTIAKCLKLEMQYFSVYDESRKNKDIHEDFIVDLVKIESVLVDFLSNDQSQVTKN
ncbi:MAG: glycosyltransferase family 61 protein [Gallionella sp.]|nr:glycosyltransferase family 61 protein [Gallionella sp.]